MVNALEKVEHIDPLFRFFFHHQAVLAVPEIERKQFDVILITVKVNYGDLLRI